MVGPRRMSKDSRGSSPRAEVRRGLVSSWRESILTVVSLAVPRWPRDASSVRCRRWHGLGRVLAISSLLHLLIIASLDSAFLQSATGGHSGTLRMAAVLSVDATTREPLTSGGRQNPVQLAKPRPVNDIPRPPGRHPDSPQKAESREAVTEYSARAPLDIPETQETEKLRPPSQDDWSAYRLALARQSRGLARYPSLALQMRWEGVAEVAVEADGRGEWPDVRLARSSGHPEIDAEALALIAAATRAAPMPPTLRGHPFSVCVAVRFGLAD